jgi:hypothetical protein
MLRSVADNQKIEALRLAADEEALDVIAAIKYRHDPEDNPRREKNPVRIYAVGDKVYYSDSPYGAYGEYKKGTITHVETTDFITYRYQVTSVKREVVENVQYLKPRVVIDYSAIVVRDEIKKMSTQKLIKENKRCRGQLSYASYEGMNAYSYWEKYYIEIRAELSTRGHFKRKAELKADRQQAKLNKLKDRVEWQKKQGKYNTKEQRHLSRMTKVK